MAARQRDRRELSFFDHLEELRMRIIRSFVYVCVGAAVSWAYRDDILAVLRYPAEEGARRVGVENLPFRVFEPAAGFTIAIQTALLAGLILALPLILIEIWCFIEPALEDNERKYLILIWPFAVVLFVGGVVFCYYVSPNAYAFLFRMDQSLGVEIERTLKPYLWFTMRLLLAFGLAFELPLVLMFLGFLGIVNSRQLMGWWRQAIVIIFVFAAIVTPTVDPVNMAILAGPMILLYLLSVALVGIVQRRPSPEGEDETPPDDETGGDDGPGSVPGESIYAEYWEGDAEDHAIPLPQDTASRGEQEPEATNEDEGANT
ncbi:MAG: twin-arginine translocase subunit TatC [Armatimonadetes bacterium]|nr:twin-arginine translocase subunit TatC [Armatimonadota bacterium]